MSLEQNEQRLLELIRQRRDDECRNLQQRAEDEARELLENAYRNARDQLHENVESERERARVRIGAARAELETRRRQHAQRLGSVVLAEAWQRLPRKLAEHWADPAGRRAWISGVLEQALTTLPHGAWRIRHPAHLAENERKILRRTVQERVGHPPRLVADGTLEAGLVLDFSGVVLDASDRGLLEDRDAIEARLLALMNLEQSP